MVTNMKMAFANLVRKHLCLEVEFPSENKKEWSEFARGQEGVDLLCLAIACTILCTLQLCTLQHIHSVMPDDFDLY